MLLVKMYININVQQRPLAAVACTVCPKMSIFMFLITLSKINRC